MSTVSDAFSQLGLVQWWKFPTQYFGENSEEGTDFGMGGFKPVGAIAGGKVIYVGDPYASDANHSSLGYVVQVLTPDGLLYHYQHLKSPNVSVGQTIQIGSVVGISGGCPVGCYGSNGQCTCTDQWTTGQHIEVRVAKYNPNGGLWGQPWVNPMTTFLNVAGGAATTIAGAYVPPDSGGDTSSSSGGSVVSDWATQFHQEGIKIGLFLVAMVLVGFGLYMLFQKQADGLLKKGIDTGKKAVEVAAL